MRKRIAGNVGPERTYEQVTDGDGIRISIGLPLLHGVNEMDRSLGNSIEDPTFKAMLRELFEHDPALGRDFVAILREK